MLTTTHRLLLGLTLLGLASAACAQEPLMGQAQQAQQSGMAIGQQAADLASQTGQQTLKQLQQQAQFAMDPQRVLEFTLNPLSSTAKYLFPNTYQGVTSDLGNGMMMMANGANRGYNTLSSQFSAMGDSLLESFQSAQNSMLKRLAQINQQQEDIVRRMYEIVHNPEQLCKQISESAPYQQAGAVLDQATRRPSTSWFGK